MQNSQNDEIENAAGSVWLILIKTVLETTIYRTRSKAHS
jgi:hypothetical protein